MDGAIIRWKAAGLGVEIPDADPRSLHQAQPFGDLGANGLGLICRNRNRRENADDGDHDHQFNQGETAMAAHGASG